MTETLDSFGCQKCLPTRAEEAWNAVRDLGIYARLVDESHFNILLRRCSACGQQFVSVFAETVDWSDGEDPQAWTVLPISEQEAASLQAATEQDVISGVYSRWPDRCSLCFDHPKNEEATIVWSRGIRARPHD